MGSCNNVTLTVTGLLSSIDSERERYELTGEQREVDDSHSSVLLL